MQIKEEEREERVFASVRFYEIFERQALGDLQ